MRIINADTDLSAFNLYSIHKSPSHGKWLIDQGNLSLIFCTLLIFGSLGSWKKVELLQVRWAVCWK